MSYFWKYLSSEEREKRKQHNAEIDAELNEVRKEIVLEKGDTLALIIAALTTVLPYAILVIGGLALVTLFVFRAL